MQLALLISGMDMNGVIGGRSDRLSGVKRMKWGGGIKCSLVGTMKWDEVI